MIHSTAQIDSSAEIDEGVSIGPFTVIGPNVKIHSGTVIEGEYGDCHFERKIRRANTTTHKGIVVFIPASKKQMPRQSS